MELQRPGKQMVSEVLKDHHPFSNKTNALNVLSDAARIGRERIQNLMQQPNFLDGYSIQASERRMESPLFASISKDRGERLEKLVNVLGIRQLGDGQEVHYEEKGRILITSAEGRLAAVAFLEALPNELERSRELILELAGGPKAARPQDVAQVAGAWLFLHLAQHGVDGVYMDLRVGDEGLKWCLSQKPLMDSSLVQAELYRIQLVYALALSDGVDNAQTV